MGIIFIVIHKYNSHLFYIPVLDSSYFIQILIFSDLYHSFWAISSALSAFTLIFSISATSDGKEL